MCWIFYFRLFSIRTFTYLKIAGLLQAAKANPPLHEGDQILYINGHSMSDQSHEHAVMLIKASKELKPCELIMVIKPQGWFIVAMYPTEPIRATITLYLIRRPVRATITLYPIGRPVRATSTLYPIGRPVRATSTLYPIGRPVRATSTLYPIGRPVRATSTLYPIGRPVRATITLYPIGRPVRATITRYPIGRPVRATITLYPIRRFLICITDLSRVNPITFNQSATHSDNPEENVKASLLHLRESLRDGTALLQFDVSKNIINLLAYVTCIFTCKMVDYHLQAQVLSVLIGNTL